MLDCNVKSIWLVTILVALVCLCDYNKVSGEDCENDIQAFYMDCMFYMYKNGEQPIDPNDRCCNVIRTANVPCVCKNGLSRKRHFPPNGTYADIIDWNKVMYCFKKCGKPLQAGFKCDRFTVPPNGPPLSKY